MQALREDDADPFVISPKLNIIREGDARMEARFFWYLVEDRASFQGGTYSYAEFMEFVNNPGAAGGMGRGPPHAPQQGMGMPPPQAPHKECISKEWVCLLLKCHSKECITRLVLPAPRTTYGPPQAGAPPPPQQYAPPPPQQYGMPPGPPNNNNYGPAPPSGGSYGNPPQQQHTMPPPPPGRGPSPSSGPPSGGYAAPPGHRPPPPGAPPGRAATAASSISLSYSRLINDAILVQKYFF